MRPMVAKILEQALQLTPDERAELVQRLDETLELGEQHHGFASAAIEAAWSAEIRQRIADLDSGRTRPIPFDEGWRQIFGDDPAAPTS